jgi:magnesium-transporting ATPase (P-type)
VALLPVSLLARIGLAGGFTAVAALVVIELRGGEADHARWLAYTILVVGQVVRAYANRSLTLSVLSLGRNTFLVVACVVVVVIQAAIPYVPPLADAFRASTLSPVEWAVVAAVALAPAVVADVVRRVGRTWVA